MNISQLPQPYRRMAELRRRQWRVDLEEDNLTRTTCFVWRITPEDHIFWSACNQAQNPQDLPPIPDFWTKLPERFAIKCDPDHPLWGESIEWLNEYRQISEKYCGQNEGYYYGIRNGEGICRKNISLFGKDAVQLELEHWKTIMENKKWQYGDIITDGEGRRKILGRVDDVLFTSLSDDFEVSKAWSYTQKELEDRGYRLEGEGDPCIKDEIEVDGVTYVRKD